MDLDRLGALRETDFKKMSADQLQSVIASLTDIQFDDRKQNQILYYTPAHDNARKAHLSTASIIGCGGGNRSSKTETQIVELVALATGVFPLDPEINAAFRGKFRGPIRVRIVIESMKTHLHPVLLPKLKWFHWEGVDAPGGLRGHWGWVPKICLKDGDWERSWSEKLSVLKVHCRNPDDIDEILGESEIQIMSFDQDQEQFASGTFADILHDEPPPFAIWSQNQARVMDVGGRLRLSMTWPDDPSIPIDWVYDEVYEPGTPGPNKDPDVDWFEFHTTDNMHIDQKSVQAKMNKWSHEMVQVRIYGQPIRFSNLVHPDFTDLTKNWCFSCGKPVAVAKEKTCPICGNEGVVEYNHVREFIHSDHWPSVFLIDPHPRKPHMFMWVQIDPYDDLWVVADGECDGDAVDVREMTDDIEANLDLKVGMRIMDPNMGRTPTAKRDITWQDEFDSAGLRCDMADDSAVGRKRLNVFLKPDESRSQPRIHFHPRCRQTIYQMKRYVWSEFRRGTDRDQKQFPKDKYDDYPTALKYLMNYEPTFNFLHHGAPVLVRTGTRKGSY